MKARATVHQFNSPQGWGLLASLAWVILLQCIGQGDRAIGQIFPTDSALLSKILYSVVSANSLSGDIVDVIFHESLDAAQELPASLFKVISPVGHTETRATGSPQSGKIILSVSPPLVLEAATLEIGKVKLASGALVSGFIEVQVRNLAARNLMDESTWTVIPHSWDEFEITPRGKGFSEQLDDAGFLSLAGTITNGTQVVVDTPSDLLGLATGIMLRKAGVGKQPFIAIVFQSRETNTVECVVLRRGISGDFTSRVVESVQISENAPDPAFRMWMSPIIASGQMTTYISAAGVRSIADLNYSDLEYYDQFGLVAFVIGESNGRNLVTRFDTELVVKTSIPMVTMTRNGAHGVNLSWSDRYYRPVRIEQFSPVPIVRELDAPKESNSIIFATDDTAGFYALRRLKR